MHGEAPTKEETRLRKANDWMTSKYPPPSGRLFDEFWGEGELALLFGAAGTGKSILATQIAEGIARGTGIDGFRVTVTRRKVLYVDLKFSEPQHQRRYSKPNEYDVKKAAYRFSENFYRDRPPDVDKMDEWLRKEIVKNSIRVVVIDDLSAVKKTSDGTRETLKHMRELRTLARELGVSILVITSASEPGSRRFASEADLQRSRVLCEAADSVFAIGLHPQAPETRYLIQTRSLNELVFWHTENAPVCVLHKADSGFLGFEFDTRFVPQIDEETRRLICDVKRRRDKDESFRVIEHHLGISRSKASRLLKRWRPEFERPGEFPDEDGTPAPGARETPDVTAEDELEEWEACDVEKPAWIEEEADSVAAAVAAAGTAASTALGPAGAAASAAASGAADSPVSPSAETPRSILLGAGCRLRLNEYDKEIFVELEDERGKPVIWYQFNAQGRLTRWRHSGFGNNGHPVNGPVCWLDSS